MFKEHEIGKTGSKRKTCQRTGRSVHSLSLERLQEGAQMQIHSEMENVQEAADKGVENAKYSVTAKMIRTVYSEVKMYIPFLNHRQMESLMKLNGIDIGAHHLDNNAAKRMAILIRKHMHTMLMRHLTSNVAKECSIILDTTTDYRGNHYLICFLKSMEVR